MGIQLVSSSVSEASLLLLHHRVVSKPGVLTIVQLVTWERGPWCHAQVYTAKLLISILIVVPDLERRLALVVKCKIWSWTRKDDLFTTGRILQYTMRRVLWVIKIWDELLPCFLLFCRSLQHDRKSWIYNESKTNKISIPTWMEYSRSQREIEKTEWITEADKIAHRRNLILSSNSNLSLWNSYNIQANNGKTCDVPRYTCVYT